MNDISLFSECVNIFWKLLSFKIRNTRKRSNYRPTITFPFRTIRETALCIFISILQKQKIRILKIASSYTLDVPIIVSISHCQKTENPSSSDRWKCCLFWKQKNSSIACARSCAAFASLYGSMWDRNEPPNWMDINNIHRIYIEIEDVEDGAGISPSHYSSTTNKCQFVLWT